MADILTPDLEREILRLQRQVSAITERQHKAADTAYWQFEPIQQVSDSKKVGQAGGVSPAKGEPSSAKFYLWTLAMGVVLGLIVGFLAWGR